MLASLRKVLIDSHVAAVTVAILLFFSLKGFYCAAFRIVNRLVLYVQIISSHQYLNILRELRSRDPDMLSVTLQCFSGGMGLVFAAWLLSRWLYGVDPMRCLASYQNKFSRKTHA